jgi:hypothetical protein
MTRVGITGHQQLPLNALLRIRAGIDAALPAGRGLTLVTSLSAGAELMAAEAALTRGADLALIVACHGFRSTLPEADQLRFDRFAALAGHLERLSFPEPSEAAFLAAGKRVVDLADRMIAVWDGEPVNGAGNTAEVVAYARDIGREVTVVW